MRDVGSVFVCAVLVAVGMVSAHSPDLDDKPLVLRAASAGRLWYESVLEKEGYAFGTTAQLEEAVRNGHLSGVRCCALYLLGERVGEGGIPVFKEALKDPDFTTRTTAARFLGAFGDKSGVVVLRQDLATFAPRNGRPDPNLMELQGDELDRAKSRRCTRLQDAIKAAEALSELGDPSGLTLASRIALEGEYAIHRMHAISALTNLLVSATSDESILAGQAINPEDVLHAVAESETVPSVLRTLMSHAARLPRAKSRKIYEKLLASPHMEAKDRGAIQSYLRLYDQQARRR